MRRMLVFATAVLGLVVMAMQPAAVAPVLGQNPDQGQDSPDQAAPSGIVIVKECRLKVRDTRELAAERMGIIAEVGARQGDPIRAGSILVRLKDDVARATFETASRRAENDIEIRYAQKAKEVAYADWDRAVETNRINPGTIPQAEIEKLKLTAEKSDLQIEQAEHQMSVSLLEVAEARAQLEAFTVKAPIHGRVSRVHKDVGEAVQQGETILEIVNTDHLIVDGYIRVGDLMRVRRGSFVKVMADGVEYNGHIIDVDEEATFVGARIKVFAVVKNEVVNPTTDEDRTRRLIAGLTATMEIDTNRQVDLEDISLKTDLEKTELERIEKAERVDGVEEASGTVTE